MNELTKVQHENRSPLFDLLSTGKPTMFKAEMLGKALDKFEPYVYIVPLTNFGPKRFNFIDKIKEIKGKME